MLTTGKLLPKNNTPFAWGEWWDKATQQAKAGNKTSKGDRGEN